MLDILTLTILKARFYAKYPDGVEWGTDDYGYKATDRLSFEEITEAMGDTIVDKVWGEWADMGSVAFNAQMEILCALEQQHWADDDWAKYRQAQKIGQARQAATKARMKIEAAERTARLAKEALNP